jgi:hypothetical protein
MKIFYNDKCVDLYIEYAICKIYTTNSCLKVITYSSLNTYFLTTPYRSSLGVKINRSMLKETKSF